MDLRLYDTLTREKRPFTPLDPERVRMYVCGPTVYDFAHIGNARPVIVFDVLFRLLRHLYGEEHVTYVRNITDVDDKINARAAERGIPIRELTEETYKNFQEDVAALGCLPPTVEPRATEHIEEMKVLIERLIKDRRAYILEDHILFRVEGLRKYGVLSHRSLDDMRTSARGEVAPKDDPMDFVLWKPSKAGEPAWPSPGKIEVPGRPGWHIECSAMSRKYLGRKFDIHGGGVDLLFPHHENELAQSRCAFHLPVMANYWMHNGFLQVEGEKMSKSLGNFVTIRELEREFPGDVLRLLMLTTHYRQPIDWTRQGLDVARKELLSWADLVLEYFDANEPLNQVNAALDERLVDALLDDLNTPLALARLREMYRLTRNERLPIETFVFALSWLGFRNINKPGFFHPGFEAKLFDSGPNPDAKQQQDIVAYRAAVANGFVEAADRLKVELSNSGFVVQLNDAGVIFVGNKTGAEMVDLENEFKQKIEGLIAERTAARKAKNFAESDRIRDELAAMGIVLKDSKDGTSWEVAR